MGAAATASPRPTRRPRGSGAASPTFATPAIGVTVGDGCGWCRGSGGFAASRTAVATRRPAAAPAPCRGGCDWRTTPRQRRCHVGTRPFPAATADSVDSGGGNGSGGGGSGGGLRGIGEPNPYSAAADAWEADRTTTAAPPPARTPPPAASAVARARRRGAEPPAASAAEWEALIEEFEDRADVAAGAVGASSSWASPASANVDDDDYDDEDEERYGPAGWQPPGSGSGEPTVENPEQYVQLPKVETALMAAVGCCLWSLGRVYRLDSFLLLLYPLPPVFVALRWDTRRAVQTVGVTVLLVACSLGPLYAFLYALGIGSLSVVMAAGLAGRWPTPLLLAATTATKVAGVAVQVSIAARLLGYGGWSMVITQVRGMLAGLGVVAAKVGLVGPGGWPAPSARTVAVAVSGVLGVHSSLLCFFSATTCMMLADAAADWGYVSRRPRMMWFLAALKRNATRAAAERSVRSSGRGRRRRQQGRRV